MRCPSNFASMHSVGSMGWDVWPCLPWLAVREPGPKEEPRRAPSPLQQCASVCDEMVGNLPRGKRKKTPGRVVVAPGAALWERRVGSVPKPVLQKDGRCSLASDLIFPGGVSPSGQIKGIVSFVVGCVPVVSHSPGMGSLKVSSPLVGGQTSMKTGIGQGRGYVIGSDRQVKKGSCNPISLPVLFSAVCGYGSNRQL